MDFGVNDFSNSHFSKTIERILQIFILCENPNEIEDCREKNYQHWMAGLWLIFTC